MLIGNKSSHVLNKMNNKLFKVRVSIKKMILYIAVIECTPVQTN